MKLNIKKLFFVIFFSFLNKHSLYKFIKNVILNDPHDKLVKPM